MDNSKEIAVYEAENGSNITLTAGNIRQLISTDPNVTDKEVMLFGAMCKAHRLDPFTKEAYLIKYGNKPATMVVSKDVFLKRAFRHPRFRGLQAGICVRTPDGGRVKREGSMCDVGETVIGGWCKVYIDGYEVPIFDEVSFDEYAGKKKDGSLNAQWAGKPGTMIRKVAMVHALREAFPEEFGGLYEATEMGEEEPAKATAEPVPMDDALPWGEPVYEMEYEDEVETIPVYEPAVEEVGAF